MGLQVAGRQRLQHAPDHLPAAVMELVIFIVFQLLIEVQSYKSPTVKASPDAIRESSSVKFSCEMPADVNSRQLICVYSLKTEPEIRSPHSDTYTIKGRPQAKLKAFASFILETDTVLLDCENTEDLKMEMCFFYINGRESSSKQSSSCQLSLTGSQISIWSGDQSSSVRIICFYTVMKGQDQKPSAHSDPVTITVQNSKSITNQQTTTTTMKTTLTTMSTAETTTYSKTLDLHSKTNLPASTAKKTIYVSVSKQQEQENPEDNENVYHLYCKPVRSNAEDHMYSWEVLGMEEGKI
ncbi:hypothetical protein QQF64_002961 [Cirrhinus molitorella]|uniref:Uncharacterized protein n=1 Tax=Cirrhinus molitorella TaxID=172907 RepID=A0ABR3MIL9_9TELE